MRIEPVTSGDQADADLTELLRPAYFVSECWLGSQGGCGVLAMVIMQVTIAVSYCARDMLLTNENSKLGNLAWTPTRLCCICQGNLSVSSTACDTDRVNGNSKLHTACKLRIEI